MFHQRIPAGRVLGGEVDVANAAGATLLTLHIATAYTHDKISQDDVFRSGRFC
jgi:hypothetical protein